MRTQKQEELIANQASDDNDDVTYDTDAKLFTHDNYDKSIR